jgi:hypothetical protein
MKFLITRTSDAGGVGDAPPAPGAVRPQGEREWHIEIADLDALARLIDVIEEPLILSRRQGSAGVTAIEVYDDMREEFR